MNTIQKGTIALLKSAICQQPCPLPPDFDLEAAYPLLKKHHMDALLYEGAMLCGIPKELPIMQKLFRNYCKLLMVNEGQMREITRIYAAFDANNIDYMPLKGCNMKKLYPKPELRAMGDADILIRMGQYDKIKPILNSLGYREGAEWDHELKWIHSALLLELHKRVVPMGNKDFFAYFGDGWQFAVPGEGTRYKMLPENEFVFLFAHFAKHYRGGGIGCRHVADLWLFLKSNPDLDETKVKTELDQLHLREFYENIRQLIAAWFENGETNVKTDFITDFLFSSGSWGTREAKTLSAGVRERADSGAILHNRVTYILRLLFPSLKVMREQYVILQKLPWLLPFAWIYRLLCKLLSKNAKKTLKTHKETLQLLAPENIQSHQEALQYVGLDYHF